MFKKLKPEIKYVVPQILEVYGYEDDAKQHIILNCRIKQGFSMNIYLKAFENILNKYVFKEEQSEDYQDGYRQGFDEGRQSALADMRKAIEGE